jgi:HEAT repeat protein
MRQDDDHDSRFPDRRCIARVVAVLALCLFATCLFATPLVAQGDDEIHALQTKLASTEVRERRDAARALSRVGDKAIPALPALIQALDDKDTQVRSHALAALAQLGPNAYPAVPRLITGLNDQRPQVRFRSAFALGRIGAKAVGPLTDALESESPQQRAGAASALAGIGLDARAAMDKLIAVLADADQTVRDEAARALGRMSPECVPPVLDALSAGDADAKSAALLVFAEVGPDAAEAIPTIRKLVADDAPAVRVRAAQALAQVGIPRSELIEVLGKLLQDEHDDVHHVAGELLLLVRPRASTVGHLTRLVEGEDVAAVLRAAYLLSQFGKVAEPAVPALVKAVARLGEQDHQSVLPNALGAVGPGAAGEILAGLAAARHPESTLRRYIDALILIGPDVLPLLTGALTHAAPQVRAGSVLALGAFEQADADIVSKIVALLDDDDAFVRASGAESLGEIGPFARAATPALAEKLDDAVARVRSSVVTALGETAGDDVAYAKHFKRGLGDEDAGVRIAAAGIMSKLPAVAAASVENLVAALADADEHVRAGAAAALGAAGDAAASGVPALDRSLHDPVAAVRAAAAQALGAIGETTPMMLENLGAAIADPSPEVRRQAVLTLRRLGPKALPAVPRLVSALEHEDSAFRILVIESFRPIIQDVPELLKPLLQATKDEDREVRRVATYEIGEIGETAQAAIPALFLLIEDDIDRYAARAAVNKISPRDIPLLIEKMQNESPFVRITACDSLNQLGPDAADALAFLEEQLADKAQQEKAKKGDYGIRRCILETVKKIKKGREAKPAASK